jgi:hypothetical protein
MLRFATTRIREARNAGPDRTRRYRPARGNARQRHAGQPARRPEQQAGRQAEQQRYTTTAAQMMIPIRLYGRTRLPSARRRRHPRRISTHVRAPKIVRMS